MSNFEYTDRDGDILEIEMRPTGSLMVSAYHLTSDDRREQIHVTVRREDAPRIALAVLDAAGVDGNAVGLSLLERAVGCLQAHEMLRAGKAEQDAEDAKVRAFLDAIPGDGPSVVNDATRSIYRAAREFFGGAK